MRPTERFIRFSTMVVAVAGLVMLGSGGVGAADPADVCQAAKLKAAGKKEACRAAEGAKEVLGKPADFAKCSGKFEASFAKAEEKAGAGVCPTEGDAAAIEAMIDGCFDDLKAALSGSPPAPCQQFPATGQTTAFTADKNDGIAGAVAVPDDGTVQVGATLSYTDNGDGTVTDLNTGLVWEKKLAAADPGCTSGDQSLRALRCVNNVYRWSGDGSQETIWDWLDDLNASNFAGHSDWR